MGIRVIELVEHSVAGDASRNDQQRPWSDRDHVAQLGTCCEHDDAIGIDQQPATTLSPQDERHGPTRACDHGAQPVVERREQRAKARRRRRELGVRDRLGASGKHGDREAIGSRSQPAAFERSKHRPSDACGERECVRFTVMSRDERRGRVEPAGVMQRREQQER